MIYKLENLMTTAQTQINTGEWVPSRPINHRHESWPARIKAAWMVFTGKADAVIWPGGQ